MNDIDCTPLTIDDATLAHLLWLARRPPWTHAPLALRVTPYQMAELLDVEFVDGHAYLGDVPVTTGETQPPPRPRAPVVVEPVVVDLTVYKAQRKVENKTLLWEHVDANVEPREREALAALMQKCTLMKMQGLEVNEWALAVLFMTLEWCDAAMKLQQSMSNLIDLATTIEEVDGIVPDLGALGPSPGVTAGQISVFLVP